MGHLEEMIRSIKCWDDCEEIEKWKVLRKFLGRKNLGKDKRTFLRPKKL